jgi:hypothetical protein
MIIILPRQARDKHRASTQRMAFRVDSTFSQYWDLAQVALLFYISITVPIRAGFEVTVPAW